MQRISIKVTSGLSLLFQSMHPIKDATLIGTGDAWTENISIHAPYKGCNVD